jgi:hypothetical protein
MKARVAILIVSLAVAVCAHETSHFNTDPRSFDSFGTLRPGDLGARLDNFAILLLEEPQTIGHIVAYRGSWYGATPRGATA